MEKARARSPQQDGDNGEGQTQGTGRGGNTEGGAERCGESGGAELKEEQSFKTGSIVSSRRKDLAKSLSAGETLLMGIHNSWNEAQQNEK